jgi:hypothetical protein
MKWLLLSLVILGGCHGAVKVVPTTPIGTPHITPDTQTTTPNGSGWVLWWMGAVALAGYATYRTFNSRPRS